LSRVCSVPAAASRRQTAKIFLRRPGAQVRFLVWPGRMHKAQTLSQLGFLELKRRPPGLASASGLYYALDFLHWLEILAEHQSRLFIE
jgi:hypothetical protein